MDIDRLKNDAKLILCRKYYYGNTSKTSLSVIHCIYVNDVVQLMSKGFSNFSLS